MNLQEELTETFVQRHTRAQMRAAVLGVCIVSFATLLTPVRLAKTERIDPITRAEQLIGERNYR